MSIEKRKHSADGADGENCHSTGGGHGVESSHSMEGGHSAESSHSMEGGHSTESSHSAESGHSTELPKDGGLADQMPNMTLETVAAACGGTYMGPEEKKGLMITGVVRDNRDVKAGNLFVAIKGGRVDGHSFVEDAFDRGAYAALVEHPVVSEVAYPCILVSSSTDAMRKLAAYYRRSLDIKVVGITGSVGKTSTKEMIASVLSQKYQVLKTDGNFNNEIGLPLTVFRIRKEHQVAVLEMGISDFGEMHRLADIANPDICVITNIGLCHLENLGTREGILNAKTECFAHMREGGTVILNGDDDMLRTKTEVNGKPVIFYGIGKGAGEDADAAWTAGKAIYAEDLEDLGFSGIRAQIHTPQGAFTAVIPIPGEHNVYNALAATAAGLELGLTLDEIRRGIASAETIAGRTNFIEAGGMTIIDDCYNANPVSMKAALEVLSHAKGRSIAVLGDMGELGENEKQLHHEVGVFAGQQKIAAVFAVGPLAAEYIRGIQETNPACELHYFNDRDSMTAELLAYVKPGDNILVKASHFMEFSKVVESIRAERGSDKCGA